MTWAVKFIEPLIFLLVFQCFGSWCVPPREREREAKELELKRKAQEAARLEKERKEREAKLEKERLQREAEELKRKHFGRIFVQSCHFQLLDYNPWIRG